MTPSRIRVVGALVVGLSLTAPAQAGVFRDVLFGLSGSGFQFIGTENPLSGGADLTVIRNFNGETLDFGATELTLAGTPTFTLSTGGRALEVLEFSLTTGGNPLNYTLTSDTGNQTITTAGSFLMNINGGVNNFGFYDLSIDVSSRQTVTEDGRILTDTFENDFDIGPIDIEGNLFADLLGVVTDPIFQLLGVDNIFRQFSAAGQFESNLSALAQAAQAKIDIGDQLTGAELSELASMAAAGTVLGFDVSALSFLDDPALQFDLGAVNGSQRVLATSPNFVPEPATLALLLAAVPWVRRRRVNR